jgi:hypothetical protein
MKLTTKMFITLGVFVLLVGLSKASELHFNNPINQVDSFTAGILKLSPTQIKPTCDSTTRGTIYFTANALGVADTTEICVKNVLDVYLYKVIALT